MSPSIEQLEERLQRGIKKGEHILGKNSIVYNVVKRRRGDPTIEVIPITTSEEGILPQTYSQTDDLWENVLSRKG